VSVTIFLPWTIRCVHNGVWYVVCGMWCESGVIGRIVSTHQREGTDMEVRIEGMDRICVEGEELHDGRLIACIKQKEVSYQMCPCMGVCVTSSAQLNFC
jgi:hypothetical protein